MPFVDRIIQFLQAQQGERIVLENDQACVIYRPGGISAPTKERLTYAQISNLVGEIVPEEFRNDFASGQPFVFPYDYGAGTVEIDVMQQNGNIHVGIGVPARDQTLQERESPPPASVDARPK